jgi:hypothetical protein
MPSQSDAQTAANSSAPRLRNVVEVADGAAARNESPQPSLPPDERAVTQVAVVPEEVEGVEVRREATASMPEWSPYIHSESKM